MEKVRFQIFFLFLLETTKQVKHIYVNMYKKYTKDSGKRAVAFGAAKAYKRKRFVAKQQLVRIPRSPPGQALPNQIICRFRYSEEISVNPTIGGVTAYVFRANSLYDPNLTGTGHQPAPYDQMKLFYKKFKVIGSKITARPIISDTNYETLNCYAGIINSKTSADYAVYSNVSNLLESKWGKRFKTIGAYTSMSAANKADAGYVSSTWSLKRDESRIATDNDFAHAAGSNPAEVRYFEVVNASVGSNDPPSHNWLVTIDYLAICMDPEVITAS